MRALVLILLAHDHLVWAADPESTRAALSAPDSSGDDAMRACEQQWHNAVRLFPNASEDKFPNLRGDDALTGAATAVLFVHVGKSCGTTVGASLARNKASIKAAYNGYTPLVQVHVHPVRPDVIAAAENVLVAVRDPVDRLVSAYNTVACGFGFGFDKVDAAVCSRNAIPDKHDTSINGSQFTIDGWFTLTNQVKSLMRCYPNVTAFADGLDDDSECGRVAREAIGVNMAAVEAATAHIGKGVCFYLGGLLKSLEGKRVHLVNTESCDADVADIPKWLGLESFERVESRHTGGFPHHDDQPSNEGRGRLRRHLAHEYWLQEELARLNLLLP